MSKKTDKKPARYEEYSESSSEQDNLDTIDAYIEASEMYLESLKLDDVVQTKAAYLVGMTAVYYGKAFLAFASTNNSEAIKGSLREALKAYSSAATFCDTNNIGQQFVYTSKLIIQCLKTELESY